MTLILCYNDIKNYSLITPMFRIPREDIISGSQSRLTGKKCNQECIASQISLKIISIIVHKSDSENKRYIYDIWTVEVPYV